MSFRDDEAGLAQRLAKLEREVRELQLEVLRLRKEAKAKVTV